MLLKLIQPLPRSVAPLKRLLTFHEPCYGTRDFKVNFFPYPRSLTSYGDVHHQHKLCASLAKYYLFQFDSEVEEGEVQCELNWRKIS